MRFGPLGTTTIGFGFENLLLKKVSNPEASMLDHRSVCDELKVFSIVLHES
jgi:serine protease inhibitor ecotin